MSSQEQVSTGLQRIASETFSLEGDVARLVTFLNQSLKRNGFIFGLRRSGKEYSLAIYRTNEADTPSNE